MLEEAREAVWKALQALPRGGLVQGTSGNVSGRRDDYVVIKPSGVDYASVLPKDLVVVDLSGRIVEGALRPSVDTMAHLHIYRALPQIGGIVHTHSVYATVFAVLGKEVPVYTTELADLFGTSIPVSSYVPPGSEMIGTEFAQRTAPGRYRALLMRNHGLFAAGDEPADALTAAQIVEHSAQIAYLVESISHPAPLPPEEANRLHAAYHEHYGQARTGGGLR